jgi:O-antigen/teichoic acid export membrane protein
MTSGTNVFLMSLGLLTGVFAARLLGPDGRGELAAIQMWPTFLASLAMLGLPDALVYYSAKTPERSGSYLASALLLASVSSFAFMFLGRMLVPLLLSAQTRNVIDESQGYMLTIPLFALGLCLFPLRGLHQFATWNFLRISPNLIWLGLLTIAWYTRAANVQSIAFAYLGLLSLSYIPIAFVIARHINRPFTPEKSASVSLLRFGVPSVLSGIPQVLNMRVDQMIMAAFLRPYDLGLYAVAVAWSNSMQPILGGISAVVFPGVASENKKSVQINFFSKAVRVGTMLSFVLAVGLWIITPWMFPLLFSKKFLPALPAAVILIFAASISGLNSILEDSIRGFGRPITIMWAELSGLVLTAVSLAVFLPVYGIVGAAIASVVGYSATLIYLLLMAKNLTGLRVSSFLRPQMADVKTLLDRLSTVQSG